jgi:hypothetical protein
MAWVWTATCQPIPNRAREPGRAEYDVLPDHFDGARRQGSSLDSRVRNPGFREVDPRTAHSWLAFAQKPRILIPQNRPARTSPEP